MGWLEKYEKDINLLELVKDSLPGNLGSKEEFEKIVNEITEIFAPLKDGSLDPGDLDNIFDNYWNRFGPREIEISKETCNIQRRLGPLYERLADASEKEWESYTKMRVRSYITHQSQQLLRLVYTRLAETSKSKDKES